MMVGGYIMATKSILKDVNIKNKRSAKKFVDALENASGKTSKTVVYSRTVTELKGDDIKKYFGDKKWQDTQD